jgi:hypothetical protein
VERHSKPFHACLYHTIYHAMVTLPWLGIPWLLYDRERDRGIEPEREQGRKGGRWREGGGGVPDVFVVERLELRLSEPLHAAYI